jgi:ketosteroid isomerase-like protein
MSVENVELMRRFVEAWNARDVEAIIDCSDPDIELHSSFAAVGGATYRGHDGLRSYQRDLVAAWGENIRVEPESYFDLGDVTLSYSVVYGRGQHSGVEAAMPVAVVTSWRDGLMTSFEVFLHRPDALTDLGMSEDALEPIAP